MIGEYDIYNAEIVLYFLEFSNNTTFWKLIFVIFRISLIYNNMPYLFYENVHIAFARR